MNDHTATDDKDPAISPPDDAETRVLGWKLFCRLLCAQAGALFLVAALICFFAFNWADIPAFAKFGGIAALMAGTAAFACRSGLDTAAGDLALLGCGLLAGPLLAVYGQVYQTGADAWELFRAWALFLIPLALVGRSAGLWAALWLTASLWAALHTHQEYGADFPGIPWQTDPYLYIVAGETAALALWDICAQFLAGPRRRFLYARWLPRCVYLALVAYLTCLLAIHILDGDREEFPAANAALYVFNMAGGAFWSLKRRDLFRPACGLLSLIGLLSALVVSFDPLADPRTLLTMLCVILIGGAYGAGKLLIFLNRSWKSRENPSAAPQKKEGHRDRGGEQTRWRRFTDTSLPLAFAPDILHFALTGRREKAEDAFLDASGKSGSAPEKAPWTARLLMALCAWVAAPIILGLISAMFINFSDTGGFLALCVFTLAAGLALSYRAGFFSGQLSLCLSLAGAIGTGILAPIEFNTGVWFLLPALAVSAVSGILSRNAACRLIATCAAIILFFLQCACYLAPPMYFSRRSLLEAAEYANLSVPFFFVCLYSLFGAGLARLRLKETRGTTLSDAGFAALLILGLLPFLFYAGVSTELHEAAGLAARPLSMSGAGAGVGLLVLLRGLSGELALSVPVRRGLYIFCAAVAALSLRLPWLGCGLFALAVARRSASLPMLGTATLFLSASVFFEYYSLSSTLLAKSCSLGGTGLTLLLTAMLTRAKPAATDKNDASGFIGRAQGHSPPGKRARSAGKIIVAACLAVFFLLFARSVHEKEVLLANGKSMILSLQPLDPRSLMQGDYMVLRFSAEDDIRNALNKAYQKQDEEIPPDLFRKGTALMLTDKNGVCSFAGIAGLSGGDGQEKAAPLIYRVRDRRIRIGSGSFFFQEGHGPAYESARFAELRVDADGNCLITRLLDDNLEYIEPGEEKD